MQEYTRPPITEAIIELRTVAPIPAADQEKLSKKLEKFYGPPLAQMEVIFEFNSDGATKPPLQTPQGYRLASSDQADIAIISPAALTASRLAPYNGWDRLYARAKENWEIFAGIAGSRPVGRIGVRFINRIDVPVDGDLPRASDYLHVYPHAPLSQVFGEFAVQANVDAGTPNWTARLASAQVPSPLVNHVSFLLDVDVARTAEIPQRVDALWEVVAEARSIKNHIFSKCITTKAEKLFE